VTIGQSLRKNALFLLSGLVSGLVVLAILRQSEGQPLVQPQSDFGIVLGFVLIAAFLVYKDLRAPNGKHQS